MGTSGLFLPLCMLELRRNSREIVGGNSAPSASPHLFYNESAKCKSLIMSDSLGPHGLHSHGILQARTLDWVAFPFSRGSSQPRD